MSALYTPVARTGFVAEMRERMSEMYPNHPMPEAGDERDAIGIAIGEFDRINAETNPALKIDPACVGAQEVWSDTDLIGWEVDSEFYYVSHAKAYLMN